MKSTAGSKTVRTRKKGQMARTREAKGWSQARLAQELGISGKPATVVSRISHWERGDSIPQRYREKLDEILPGWRDQEQAPAEASTPASSGEAALAKAAKNDGQSNGHLDRQSAVKMVSGLFDEAERKRALAEQASREAEALESRLSRALEVLAS